MKNTKSIPFILLTIGTLGLLSNEFIFTETGMSRYLILTFATLNALGLIILILTHKKF